MITPCHALRSGHSVFRLSQSLFRRGSRAFLPRPLKAKTMPPSRAGKARKITNKNTFKFNVLQIYFLCVALSPPLQDREVKHPAPQKKASCIIKMHFAFFMIFKLVNYHSLTWCRCRLLLFFLKNRPFSASAIPSGLFLNTFRYLKISRKPLSAVHRPFRNAASPFFFRCWPAFCFKIPSFSYGSQTAGLFPQRVRIRHFRATQRK